MVEHVHGSEELMNYTNLINIFKYINKDETYIHIFNKITGYRQLPD